MVGPCVWMGLTIESEVCFDCLVGTFGSSVSLGVCQEAARTVSAAYPKTLRLRNLSSSSPQTNAAEYKSC